MRLFREFGIGIVDKALQLISLFRLQIAFSQALVLLLDLQGTFSEICRYSFEVLRCCLRGRLEWSNCDDLVRYRGYCQRQTDQNRGQDKQTVAFQGLEKTH